VNLYKQKILLHKLPS